jgi:hypothetical protein
MAKKLKKAILAGLTAYAGAKMLGEKQKSDWIKKNNADVMNKRFAGKPHLDRFVEDKLTGDGKGMEGVYKPKHFKPSKVPGEKKKGWFSKFWDGSGIGFRSKGGSVKSYSGGGAINTRLNGKVKFRTY